MALQSNINSDFFHKILILDIETVPIANDYNTLNSAYQAHWQRKHEQISKYMEDEPNIESSFFQRAGIYAEFGKIICISVGKIIVNDGVAEVKIKSYHHDDEKELLIEFFKDINNFFSKWPDIRCAGHNIKEFDVPYICRRAIIHQLELPEIFKIQGLKPWQIQHIDSLELWKFGDYKHYISLDLLAHLLDIESSKVDINGSDVAHEYWHEKNLDRIVKYCERDVFTTAQIISRLNMWPIIFLEKNNK